MSAIARTKNGISLAAGSVIALIAASGAHAGLSMPDFGMVWDASGDNVPANPYNPAEFGEVIYEDDDSVRYLGGFVGEGWELDWNCLVRDRGTYGGQGFGSPGGAAFVDANIVVTNTSSTVQTFSLLMSLNVADPILPDSLINGAVSATVTNNQFSGGADLNAASGDSIYKGFIDLVDPFTDAPVATLLDDPYSLSTPDPFGTASDSAQFGDPDPLAGPAVNSNIAILLSFELSPGDSASVTGLLNVIPTPGAIALLGIAGFAGGRRRRA